MAELVRRAAEGNGDATDQLIRRFLPRVRAALRQRMRPELRRRIDTDDLVQSTMTTAIRDLRYLTYRGEKALLAWLLTIADRKVGMAARHHRAACRDIRREGALADDVPAPQEAPTPIGRAVRLEERLEIEKALSRLEGPARQVVELRAFEGLSFREVASRLSLPSEDAARRRYVRALKKLQRALHEPS